MNKVFIIMPSKNYYRLRDEYTAFLVRLIGRENCNRRSGDILIPAANTQIRMINPDASSSWRGLCLSDNEWLITSTNFSAYDGDYVINLEEYFSRNNNGICTGKFSNLDDMIESVVRMVKGRIKWAESL